MSVPLLTGNAALPPPGVPASPPPAVVLFELRPTWEGCLKRATFPASTFIRPVRSSADAVAEITAAANAVLIVDVSIPIEIVIDLLAKCRRFSRLQRIIVLRSADEMPAEWGLRELGALHVLPETCTPGRLTDAVTAALFPPVSF